MSTAPETSTDADRARQAWQETCARLAALGDRIFDPDFPTGPVDRVEGLRHLAEQMVCWTAWSVSHADPRRPMFQRQNDLVTKWGGPNVENVYRHARVDARHRYRIRGRMNSCEQFLLAVRLGFMGQERWGTVVELTATDLGIEAGDDFEFTVGGAPEPGTEPPDIVLPTEAFTVSIREYYFDWRALEPAVFTIECLDPGPVEPQVTGADLADRLDSAVRTIESSIEYWNRYMANHRAAEADNAFAPPIRVDKGLAAARYAFCFHDLAADQALIVAFPAPTSEYWGLQLASMAWFESLDFASRITSLNHRQLHVDDDGWVRVVISARDPGVANWLDTEGRRIGLCTVRWFWGGEPVTPSTELVPVTSVRQHLPAGTPAWGPSARAEQVRKRREHVAWRFRT